jgi:hypothetical protein
VSDTPPLGCDPASWPNQENPMAVRKDLRSTSGESDYLLALTRLRPERRPGEIRSGYAAALAWRNGQRYDSRCAASLDAGLASGTAHNTHCPFGRSFFAST